MFFDGNTINIAIAFTAGIITFFASCLLPLVPVYLAYLSGVSLAGAAVKEKWVILKTSIAFVIGFVAVFVILGMTLTTLNRWLIPYRIWIERVAGLLFMTLGLYLTGVLKLRIFSQDLHPTLNKWFKKNTVRHAAATGIAFGFGWTPCIGPVLGVILFWASRQATYAQGILMLIVYGLGLGLPFVLVGLGFEKLVPFLKKSARLGSILQTVAGIIIIFAGIFLILGQVQRFSLLLIDFFGLRALSV